MKLDLISFTFGFFALIFIDYSCNLIDVLLGRKQSTWSYVTLDYLEKKLKERRNK